MTTTSNQFLEFNLSETRQKKISEAGFSAPTPIQALTIPRLMQSQGHSILQSATGTGKTAAFVIPLLECLMTKNKGIQCLILAPTRELAKQILSSIRTFSSRKEAPTALLIGGECMRSQLQQLKGNPKFVVGTPGRVLDHLQKKNSLDLKSISHLVLDEADEMMAMGFIDDIKLIIGDSNPNKQMLWVSATMPAVIQSLASDFLPNYETLKAQNVDCGQKTSNIDHQYILSSHKQRYQILKQLIDQTPGIYGVVFCRTKRDVDELKDRLKVDDIHVTSIHGDMPQSKRLRNLNKLKQKKADLMLATDVAARGIHIDDLSHVINYTLPDQIEPYVHRTGRTGRAGKKGTAISFIQVNDERQVRAIEKHASLTIDRHELSPEVRGDIPTPSNAKSKPRRKNQDKRPSFSNKRFSDNPNMRFSDRSDKPFKEKTARRDTEKKRFNTERTSASTASKRPHVALYGQASPDAYAKPKHADSRYSKQRSDKPSSSFKTRYQDRSNDDYSAKPKRPKNQFTQHNQQDSKQAYSSKIRPTRDGSPNHKEPFNSRKQTAAKQFQNQPRRTPPAPLAFTAKPKPKKTKKPTAEALA